MNNVNENYDEGSIMEIDPNEVEYKDTKSPFKKDPEVNVITKEQFEERVEKVFHILWNVLAKSFGPYGAPTLIYNYPYSHVTKDGYTIMKSLSMNASETKVDEAIKGMAADICGRLNYSVGDGTTSAIIATNSIYMNYRNNYKDKIQNGKFLLPRDIMFKYDKIKEDIISELKKKVVKIQSDDMEELKKNIEKVVYISSNGDELFTEYISDLYKELGAPSITCKMAPDGVTKKDLIKGYKYGLTLNDKLYINNDDNTMSLRNADVVIFSTKINADIYEHILKPLNSESAKRGRHLIVAAPIYDENTLAQKIVVDLNNEYKKTHKVNMVLCTYRAINAHSRKLVNDFATLMNTTVIDRALSEKIITEKTAGVDIERIFSIDTRDINDMKCIGVMNTEEGPRGFLFNKGVDVLTEEMTPVYDTIELIEDYIDLGFVRSCNLGLEESIFTDMVYDEEKYKVILADAKLDLEEKERKYQKLGTFNVEVSMAQERYYALKLKMGVIEVGADSELSQKMVKDAVDDAIRAAASAFKHGVVLGCNVNLIQVIKQLSQVATDQTDKLLLGILEDGFKDVYKTVLRNAFPSEELDFNPDDITNLKEFFTERFGSHEELFPDWIAFKSACHASKKDGKVSVHDILINYSILTDQVLDVSKMKYNKDVINSVQTDEEILKATIDLISLLIVGNQMVITQKNYF